jgi:NADH-quinone oxidoreductase subunit M
VLDIEFSVDSISMLFLFLTSFIFYICTFLAFETFYEDLKSLKLFFFLLFVMQSFVSAAFFAVSPVFFYFFFEAVLVPMYLIIVLWGARLRKIKAAYLFFMYTIIFSFFLLYSLVILYNSVNYVF